MRTWKHVEIAAEFADAMKNFLRTNCIKCETSGCYNLVLFAVYVTDKETLACNAFLDSLAA